MYCFNLILTHNSSPNQASLSIGSRPLVFRQLKRKKYYFLQLYLTGVLHPQDESQNVPHNACRIRNDPKTIELLYHISAKLQFFRSDIYDLL